MGYVAKSVEPDGYTILVHSAAFAIQPATFPNLGYDSGKDFAGVTLLGNAPLVMIASPAKYKTLKQLVGRREGQAECSELCDRRLRRGRAPDGGAAADGRRLRGAADSVPRRAGGGQRGAGRAGRFLLHRRRSPRCRSFAHGKLSALAVSGSKRAMSLPEVPTTIEAGYPNSDYNFWIGMWVPVKTPREVDRPALSGDPQGAGHSDRAGEAHRARQRAGQHDARASSTNSSRPISRSTPRW